jgi:hypothetical protein
MAKSYSGHMKLKNLENAIIIDSLNGIEISWNSISRNKNLSDEFFEKYFDKFKDYELSNIVSNNKFSIDFLEKHFDKLDINQILSSQNLSEEFLKKHISDFDGCNLTTIIRHQKLSENFIKEYNQFMEKDKFMEIIRYQKLSCEFLEKHINEIINIDDMIRYQKLSLNFIEKNIDKIKINNNRYYDNMQLLMEHQELTEEFVDKYYQQFNNNDIINRQKFSIEFLKNNIERFSNMGSALAKLIEKKFNISEEFIESVYKDNNNFHNILFQKNLSEEFLKNHLEDLNPQRVLETQNLSLDFIKYINDNYKIEPNKDLGVIIKNIFYSIINYNNYGFDAQHGNDIISFSCRKDNTYRIKKGQLNENEKALFCNKNFELEKFKQFGLNDIFDNISKDCDVLLNDIDKLTNINEELLKDEIIKIKDCLNNFNTYINQLNNN